MWSPARFRPSPLTVCRGGARRSARTRLVSSLSSRDASPALRLTVPGAPSTRRGFEAVFAAVVSSPRGCTSAARQRNVRGSCSTSRCRTGMRVANEEGCAMFARWETRRQSQHRSRRLSARPAAAAIAVAVAVAVPAHADPTLYVVSTGSGNVFQYGLDNDGSLSPLAKPTAAAGQSPGNVVVSPNGRSVYVTTRGAVAQYDVSSAGVCHPRPPPRCRRDRYRSASPSPRTVARSTWPTREARSSSTTSAPTAGCRPRTPRPSPTVPQPTGSPVEPGRPLGLRLELRHTGPEHRPRVPVRRRGRRRACGEDAGQVPADDGPSSVAVSPDGGSVYATNADADTVSQYNVGRAGACSLRSPRARWAPAMRRRT